MATLRFVSPLPDLSSHGSPNKTVVINCRPGQTIFDIGRTLDIDIQTACVGKGTCGLCRIRLLDGTDQVSPYNDIEEKHLGNLYHLTKLRLSCQCVIAKDAGTIEVEIIPKKVRKKKRG